MDARLIPVMLACPYCGESIELLIDGSVPVQDYVEDCPVCCSPIELAVVVNADGDVQVNARSGDEG